MLEMIVGVLVWLLVRLLIIAMILVAIIAGAGYYLWNGANDAARDELRAAGAELKEFYRCVWFFLRGGKYTGCPSFHGENDRGTRVRLFGMCLMFRLWSLGHYRNGTFQEDMHKNLRNVAVPGTGVPLSVFAQHKCLPALFLLFVYPLCALAAAVYVSRKDGLCAVSVAFSEQLLRPTDWFSLWRLNCALASYHASVTKEPAYALEDKLTFLQVAEEKGVAVSPYLKLPSLVCKHRNEEGGLGISFFSNAVCGGDWIIQEALTNDETIAAMLPEDAPLSTFRVITMSSCRSQEVTALSCVWRAGLKGSKTDHSAVLFDVGRDGVIQKGITNLHWYRLGADKIFSTRWRSEHDITHHPDTGRQVTGEKVDTQAILDFATSAHEKMMPGVTIAGWDVALTDKGMLMLECNLSCNFFYGSFDNEKYFRLVEEHLLALEISEGEAKKKLD